jgi:hypothetical protein
VLHKAAQQASMAAQLTWQLRLTMVRVCHWCRRNTSSWSGKNKVAL